MLPFGTESVYAVRPVIWELVSQRPGTRATIRTLAGTQSGVPRLVRQL